MRSATSRVARQLKMRSSRRSAKGAILGVVAPLSGGDPSRAVALAGMMAIVSGLVCILLGATDRAIKLKDRLASCFHDERRPEWIEHDFVTLVGPRVGQSGPIWRTK
jgi:hypothetical protein